MTSVTLSLPPKVKARSVTLLLIVAGTVLSLCMGVRQSLGLFLEPIRTDLGASASAFGFAMALQNLVWGLTQPIVGMLGDRYGPRPVLVGCGLIYVSGLLLMAAGGPVIGLYAGSGLLVGIGVAGCGFGVVLGAVSRAVPAEKRTQAVGIVSAAGSLATLVIAPFGQQLIRTSGWQFALVAFAAIAGLMAVISIFIGPKVSEQESEPRADNQEEASSGARHALTAALAHPGFLAMTAAFFACGFQLQFITFHLPSYLGVCGVDPAVSAAALGVIGVANAAGSYVAGRLGGWYSKKQLLALIYLLRTVTIICFLSVPVSAPSVVVFAAAMGFLWLGVVPLVSGLIGHMFGVKNFNMLFGVTFLSHQAGGFLGAWLGGLAYDLTGSYATAWGSMIVVGLSAFILQWFVNDSNSPSCQGPGEALVEARA